MYVVHFLGEHLAKDHRSRKSFVMCASASHLRALLTFFITSFLNETKSKLLRKDIP